MSYLTSTMGAKCIFDVCANVCPVTPVSPLSHHVVDIKDPSKEILLKVNGGVMGSVVRRQDRCD